MQNQEPIKDVALKFICNENWEKMHPVEGGRHCDVCNKKVVDFTNKTQNDFTRAWQEADGKLCGRFKAKQTIHLPQFTFDRAAAIAATSTLLLSAATLSAQKVGKIAPPRLQGEPAPIHVEDSTKKIKPPVICNKPVKGQWETMVRMGDTIAPIEPPVDTIPDTTSKKQVIVPDISMLGGPKMLPVNQVEFINGNVLTSNPIIYPEIEAKIDTVIPDALMGFTVTPIVPPLPDDFVSGENVMGKPKPVEPVEPEPKDGTDGMNHFIDANIRWPEKLDHNLTVFVQVRIDKDGKVFDAYIIRGYRQDVDSEAIRVARLIDFNPARNANGQVVESVLTIPINFTYRQH